MAPPTVRSVSAASNTQGNLAVAKPAGLVAGDYLLGWHYSEDDNALSAMGGPSGWALLGSEAGLSSGGHPNVKVWAKVATSTDVSASSFTFTNTDALNDNSAVVLAVSAGTYNTTTPVAAGPTFQNGGSALSTSHTAPSVTGVVDGLLVTAHGADTGGTAATYTPPGGMTERADTNGGSGAFTALEVNTLTLTAAGATGAKTATCSVSSGWKSVALVVNPATISGGGGGGGGSGGGSGGSPAGFGYSGFLDGQPYPTIPPGTAAVSVTSSSALTAALANATAGQRIVLASGTYSGAFSVSAKAGTATAGISIEAATAGGAVLASGSSLTVSNSTYVTVQGLSFPYVPASGSVVLFTSGSHHCRVTRCLFGPTTLAAAATSTANFVYLDGSVDQVRVDHNELRNKHNLGCAILADGNAAAGSLARHVRIDHNYLHDIKPEASSKEIIRIGIAAMSKSFSYSVVERNVLVDCVAAAEPISVQASGIRVSGNTLLRCIGSLTYRYGTSGVLSDNYVVDDGVSAVPAGSYRYYKFAPSALRNTTTADSVQISEFAVYNGGSRLVPATVTATNNSSPVGQEPDKAADGSTATKWLSFNKTTSTLVYDFGSPMASTGYRWATGDDFPERDPVSWTVQASNDGVTWTIRDTRSSYATTTSRSTFVSSNDFLWGGGGGTSVPGATTQTLGVGGVATPPGAILATSDQPGVLLNITTSGTSATNRRVYDGQGHKIGQIKIRASYVTVQNYRVESRLQYGIDCKLQPSNHDVIIQNNDIKDVRPSGDGDLNAMTINGDDIKILYNTVINFVGQASPGSHTDGIQTWNDGPGNESTSNLYVIGNHFEGPPADDGGPEHIHQALIGEGKDSTDGGGGGDGVSQNWFIADNYWTADCKFDDIDNVTFTRNNFAGIDKRAVVVTSLSSGFKYYSDNVVTGQYTVEIGAPVIPGPGPATPTFGGTGPGGGGGGGGGGDGTAATAFGWGTPLTASDEFAYSGSPDTSKWEVLTGAGYNGNGTRSTARVTVNGSAMVISGLAGNATTGAVLHKVWQRYGRWEARCRSSVTGSGTNDYRVGLLLWPADGVVNVPPTSMQDVDTSDTPEVAWPHQAGLPGERVDVNIATSGLPTRYANLTTQAVAIWERSSVIHPVIVSTCPGGNCATVRTQPTSPDGSTDGETDSVDNGTRSSSTVTLYRNLMDAETDNGALVTIAHELGHVFGLVHRNNSADMMNATTGDSTNPIPDLIDYTNLATFYASGASGQYFFLEAAQAGQSNAILTLHYPRLSGPDTTVTTTVTGLDLTQWHNYAIEWSSNEIIIWIDGVERMRRLGGATSALRALQATRGPMRLAMQLDALTGTGMRAAQMEVEWARAYPLP